MNQPLPDLGEHCPDLPKSVQKTLQAIAEKSREDRPADMATAIAMLEDLRPRFLDLAPLATRAVALIVDYLLTGFMMLLAAGGVGILLIILGAGEPSPWLTWLGQVVNLGIFVFAQLGMERLVGGSLAKLLFNLRVTAKDGGRPETRALVIRFLIRFPFAPLFLVPATISYAGLALLLGSLLLLVSILAGALCYYLRGRKTLSDVLTGTRVIYFSPDREPATA